MAVFWLTFRIKKDAGYEQRYEALKTAVNAVKEGTRWWAEPTSFILFKSQFTIDQVAARIKGALNTASDMALIGMPEVKDARVVGKLEDEDLFEFMPFTKRA